MNGVFYRKLPGAAAARYSQPALRYGRFYSRPVLGDCVAFGISPYPGGILAWSHILNDQEVFIVANTNTTQSQSVDVILERTLSAAGDMLRVLYSNKSTPAAPAPVRTLNQGTVAEVDGTTGTGPLNTVGVTLQLMEVQFLRI